MGVRDITLLYMNPASRPPELVNFIVRNMQAESCLMPLMRRGGESARAFEGQIQREREIEKERQKDRRERQRERASERARAREREKVKRRTSLTIFHEGSCSRNLNFFLRSPIS